MAFSSSLNLPGEVSWNILAGATAAAAAAAGLAAQRAAAGPAGGVPPAGPQCLPAPQRQHRHQPGPRQHPLGALKDCCMLGSPQAFVL